jgi:hypothetical protein
MLLNGQTTFVQRERERERDCLFYFPLKPPRVAVDVENSTAENEGKRFPFQVVVEPGFKHVLNLFRVGGDDVAEHVNIYSPGWRVPE